MMASRRRHDEDIRFDYGSPTGPRTGDRDSDNDFRAGVFRRPGDRLGAENHGSKGEYSPPLDAASGQRRLPADALADSRPSAHASTFEPDRAPFSASNSAPDPSAAAAALATSPEQLIAADMHNESDALHILAIASNQAERGGGDGMSRRASTSEPSIASGALDAVTNGKRPLHAVDGDKEDDHAHHHHHPSRKRSKVVSLNTFPLIEQDILDGDEVIRLCHAYFKWHHIYYVGTAASVDEGSRD